jgi:hypothetical protein
MNKLQVPLSNEDLEHHLGSQRIVKYADLKHYKNLYDLLPLKNDRSEERRVGKECW